MQLCRWKKRYNRVTRLLVVVAFQCFVLVVQANGAELKVVPGDDLKGYPRLREAIIDFYSLEIKRNWISLYDMRPARFWESVPYDSYRYSMERDAKRGILVSIQIVSADTKPPKLWLSQPPPNLVRVILRFVDQVKPAASAKKGHGEDTRAVENVSETFWLTEGGVWKCLICADRGYLMLNGQMTF